MPIKPNKPLKPIKLSMRKTILTALVAILTLTISAQTARQQIADNPFLCGSNYIDYDNYPATAALTPTPKGYEVFYLSHYGRHGSRWLIGEWRYQDPLNTLRKAKAQGKLTQTGERVLAEFEAFMPSTVKRHGDLTTVGERQHHGIGRRMVQHFPKLFKRKGLPIDARSTVVPRCILSMIAECEELMAANPTARIHNDVSQSLQYYLNQDWDGKVREAGRKGGEVKEEYKKRYTHSERLSNLFFNDQQWVSDSINAGHFMRCFFTLAANMQSHEGSPDFLQYFTKDELYDQWRIMNVDWYISYGPSPITSGIMPFSQRNLLRNIIETADTITKPQATLRFGHEVCVMPLACLLELGTCGAVVENLDTLDNVWRNYDIFPMGCNIQLVFYRPKKGREGDVLVKALLNEREVSLPVPTKQYPYYRWADLRTYYVQKLDRFGE